MCLLIVRYIKKGKYMNKLEIVSNNQNFSKKSFDSDVDSILINCPITIMNTTK